MAAANTPSFRHVGIFRASDVTELLDPQPSMAELFDGTDTTYGTAGKLPAK
jgi:hypothetical protein